MRVALFIAVYIRCLHWISTVEDAIEWPRAFADVQIGRKVNIVYINRLVASQGRLLARDCDRTFSVRGEYCE